MEGFPHTFRDEGLLAAALDPGSVGFERLEWLGDRALGFAVATVLYDSYADRAVGELSRAHSWLVGNDRLVDIGAGLGLDARPDLDGKRVADVVEALLGAVLVDGGMDAVVACVRILHGDAFGGSDPRMWEKDPKTLLKELCEAKGKEPPSYSHDDAGEEGFGAECSALGRVASGRGRTKAAAEAAAAAGVLAGIEADAAKASA